MNLKDYSFNFFVIYKNILVRVVFALSHGSILSVVISAFLGLYLIDAMNNAKDLRLMMLLHFLYSLIAGLFELR